jgi:hypothetical protein
MGSLQSFGIGHSFACFHTFANNRFSSDQLNRGEGSRWKESEGERREEEWRGGGAKEGRGVEESMQERRRGLREPGTFSQMSFSPSNLEYSDVKKQSRPCFKCKHNYTGHNRSVPSQEEATVSE